MAQRRYMVWIDGSGFTRLTLMNSTAGCAAVQAALLAVSNADVLNNLDAALAVNTTPAPVLALYAGVADCAGLTFQDAGGSKVVIQLPAPQSAIFMTDQSTVDPAAIAALIAQVTGTILTAAGNPVTAFVGGSRRPTTRENYQ